MIKNPFAYLFSCLFVLVAHGAMLINIFYNGKYDDIKDLIILAAAVLGLDISYYIIMLFFKQ